MVIEMAYNFKADWNQFQKATTQFLNENRYSAKLFTTGTAVSGRMNGKKRPENTI